MSDSVEMQIKNYYSEEPVYTLLDLEDFERLRRWKWHLDECGYARRGEVKIQSDGKKKYKTLLLHRVVLGVEYESADEMCVDHINGNRLDNRKCNLRVVPFTVNAANRHVALSTAGEIGVTEQDGRYIARLRREHVSTYLGCYDSAQEARKAIELFDTFGEQTKAIQRLRPVEQYDLNGNYLNRYSTNAEAQRQTGIAACNISRCANGKRETAGGFKWQYTDAECLC